MFKLLGLIQMNIVFLLFPMDDPPNYLKDLKLQGLIDGIINTLFVLGSSVCVIGLIVGGLMRATAFGSERRIATSNLALSCAVIGFLIVVLAKPIAGVIGGIK